MAQSDGIEVVALPRQGGKTTTLIERMESDPDLIYVTFSALAAHHAWRAAGADIQERHRYVTPRGLEERKFSIGRSLNASRTRVVVDEALRVLEVVLGMEVAAVAFSLEDDSDPTVYMTADERLGWQAYQQSRHYNSTSVELAFLAGVHHSRALANTEEEPNVL